MTYAPAWSGHEGRTEPDSGLGVRLSGVSALLGFALGQHLQNRRETVEQTIRAGRAGVILIQELVGRLIRQGLPAGETHYGSRKAPRLFSLSHDPPYIDPWASMP